MRYFIPTALLAAVCLAPCPAFAVTLDPGLIAAPETEGAQYIVTLKGMMCMDCQNKVKAALEKMDAVAKADVDWEKGSATVTLKDPYGVLTLKDVQKALADLKDFTVTEVKKA